MALIFSLLIRSVIRTSNGMTGMISYLADLGAQKDGEDASIASFSAGVGQCRAICVHIYIYMYISPFPIRFGLRFFDIFSFSSIPSVFVSILFLCNLRAKIYISIHLFFSLLSDNSFRYIRVETRFASSIRVYTYIYTYTVHATCALTPSCVSV